MSLPARPIKVFTEEHVHRAERKLLKVGRDKPLTALCLSGGGIRSAAFCLGAVQALAKHQVLTQFHYLSTVSGGGYIGAWLTRCIGEMTEVETPPRQPATSDAAKAICEILAEDGENEPEQLSNLRRYSNYLTPHPGLLSDDTWAGIILWLRNTLINWLVFVPVIIAVAAVPATFLAMICWFAAAGNSIAGFYITAVLSVLALLSLGIAVFRATIHLPSHAFPDDPNASRAFNDKLVLSGTKVRRQVVSLALVWTTLVPLCAAPLLRPPEAELPVAATFIVDEAPPFCPWPTALDPRMLPSTGDVGQAHWWAHRWSAALLPGAAGIVCIVAYLFGWYSVSRSYSSDPTNRNRRKQTKPFCSNLVAWIVSCLGSAGLLCLGIVLARGLTVLLLAAVGPLWVMGCEVLRSTLYVALRRDGLRSDLDREWLARLNGAKLRSVLGFALVATATLVLPRLVLDPPHPFWKWIVAVVALAGGPIGALLGKSAATAAISNGSGGRSGRLSPEFLANVAISVFALALLMLFGRLTVDLALFVPKWFGGNLKTFSIAGVVLVALGCGLALLLGGWINLNRFSMHAVYRNRLVRAFLGSARTSGRRPDPYTGFDPRDDVRVADTFVKREPRALFPVINVALNRTSKIDTARAERKAESFTITPFHCGSPGLRVQTNGEEPNPGAYVRTKYYAVGDKETGPNDKRKGIRLSTAMTISGAAASPDMGYRSSPFTAFVMTLFNVRLGAWLPNPGAEKPTNKSLSYTGPRNAVCNLLNELAGLSSITSQFIYLSDGGHFDNLGLYEMLRRRCEFIVVVDAGHDPDYGYFDLGRALQHALVDRGVKVSFLRPLVTGQKNFESYGAYAEITYPKPACSSGTPALQRKGQLLYIKPWLPKDAPTALQAFGAANKQFPHNSTLNQFFTESDFESYRSLGNFLVSKMLTVAHTQANNSPTELCKVFDELRRRAKSPYRDQFT